jgi:hypothetical protein
MLFMTEAQTLRWEGSIGRRLLYTEIMRMTHNVEGTSCMQLQCDVVTNCMNGMYIYMWIAALCVSQYNSPHGRLNRGNPNSCTPQEKSGG